MQQDISNSTDKKFYIIDDKINDYKKRIKNNFNTNIIIDTSVVQSNNESSINYNAVSERFIYNKAKALFSKIGKQSFNNCVDTIIVSNNDIKESIDKTIKNPKQKKKLIENISIFSKLDKIIENSVEIAISKKDLKGRTKYKDYKYYVSNVIIDGKKYIVEFDTRVQNAIGIDERHFRLGRVYPL